MNIATPPAAFDAALPAMRQGAGRPSPFEVAILDGFDFLSDEYRRLFASSDGDGFRHPIWLDAFYDRLAPARGARPVIVTIRSATERLVGLLPLILRRKNGLLLLETADLGVSDYASPVIDGASRGALCGDPALSEAVARALPAHDLMRIRPIRPERMDDWRLFLGGREVGLDFSAHEAHPTRPYEAWRAASLTPAYRKYLDRRKKRFLKSGDARLSCLAPEEAAAAVAEIRRLREGRFAGDPIQEAAAEGFYADVAARGMAAGLVRLYRLSLDGEAVGTVFALTHAGRLYYLLIGCDYEAHGRHSPGLVMYDLMMEDWAGAGGEIFDFTIGDEAFKADYGTYATPMSALVATPTLKGRTGLAAFEARARVGALARALAGRVRTMRERGRQ